MKIKNVYLKYIAIGLVSVFLTTTALLCIEVWEKNQGKFSTKDENSAVIHEGKEMVLKDQIETFLVLGLDKSEDPSLGGDGHQADFLMLFVLDNETKECTAIHVNRDTMAAVNRLDIAGNKIGTDVKQIALAYNYGYDTSEKVNCRNTADAVSGVLMNVRVNHYISFTMDSVAAMNDLVGGVEVTVQDDFTGIDQTLVKGETVTLMGEQALTYVRSRKGLEDSSNSTRMERQQQYINALYDKTVACVENDEEFAVEWVKTMDEYVVFDSSNQRMMELVKKLDEYEFKGIKNIEGENKIGQYVEFYPDESSVKEIVMELFYEPKA